MAKTMHTLCWVTFTWGGFLRTASLLRPGVQIPLGHTAYYASSPSVCVGQRPSPYRLRLGVPLVGLWGPGQDCTRRIRSQVFSHFWYSGCPLNTFSTFTVYCFSMEMLNPLTSEKCPCENSYMLWSYSEPLFISLSGERTSARELGERSPAEMTASFYGHGAACSLHVSVSVSVSERLPVTSHCVIDYVTRRVRVLLLETSLLLTVSTIKTSGGRQQAQHATINGHKNKIY